MRGRKPKPTKQQIAEGDPRKRGVHKLDAQLEAEPKAERGLPARPGLRGCRKHLGKIARAVWKHWKEELEKMELDCRADQVMLEGACVNYQRAVEADLLIAKHGMIIAEPITDNQGNRIGQRARTNPAVAISNACWRTVHSFCSEFGLSPVSRTRLTIDEKDSSQQDLLKLLSQPRERKAAPPTTVQ